MNITPQNIDTVTSILADHRFMDLTVKLDNQQTFDLFVQIMSDSQNYDQILEDLHSNL